MRAAIGSILVVACLPLAACDSDDPLGLYPEPAREVIAPLELTGRVVDAADILSVEEEKSIADKLESIELDTLAQLVVVTTPSLDGYSITDYSLALGRGWGIGDSERNDGLLLVVAPNDRKVRIEVGYGLEETIEDPEAKEIITQIIPMFRTEDYFTGITLGVDLLDAELHEPILKEAA